MEIRTTLRAIRRHGPFLFKQLFRRAPKLVRATIETASLEHGKIVLTGHIMANYTPHSCHFILRKFRDETITQSFPINILGPAKFTLAKKISFFIGFRWDRFSVLIDFPWQDMPSSIYGMGFQCGDQTSHPKLAPGTAQILTDDLAKRTYCLFVEPSVQVPRIEMYHFGSDVLAGLKHHAMAPRNKKLNCVIGEYSNAARDNGRVFFEWLKEAKSSIHASYIVEQNNNEDYSVDQTGVLTFGTIEHLKACIDAHICVFTHHRNYVYPYILHFVASDRYRSTKTLFLQHGVIAMKTNIVSHYHYNRAHFDGFVVSSEKEKEIIVKYFGYPSSHLFVTGLARFDRLFQKSQIETTPCEQVLIFPTWRVGLEKKTPIQISQTPFILQWQQAMIGVRKTGIRTVLILHPLLHRHAEHFTHCVDEIRSPNTFQDTLLESVALITDYSSVSFDALYAKKPVFLFQFDQAGVSKIKQVFVNVKTQLPGMLSRDLNTLISQIESARLDNWAFKHHAQSNLYFENCDAKNCARIENVIIKLANKY